ncbi:hypothetical protein NQ317_000935 [Molorchus minor]|uniref:Uncharacterized protein n=1 Tax=Molorchus minor TaxID=1323400 RepID=A0ABQ9JFQ5_9CUCU|nr:hypothetical protein NQ317_000935 [Molorchus minor]
MSCSSVSNQADEADIDLGDPMDFLDAAVSVAIQKKGLSYGGSIYNSNIHKLVRVQRNSC